MVKKTRGKPFMISSMGRVQDCSGYRYHPKPQDHGYCGIRRKGYCSVYMHRIVHLLFNDPKLEKWFPGATVDHWPDRNPENNSKDNLRWATPMQQRVNQKRKAGNSALGKPVRLTKGSTSIVFPSVSAAAAHIGALQSGVAHVMSPLTTDSSIRGWRAEAVADPDLPNEEWRSVPSHPRRFVSSLGRVQVGNSLKRWPVPAPDGYCNYAHRKVHIWVIELFGPPCPGPIDEYTVDHLDRSRANNAIANLEWATLEKQARNRSASAPRQCCAVEAREVVTTGARRSLRVQPVGEWQLFADTRMAVATLGVASSSITGCIGTASRSRTAAGSSGKRYEFRRPVDPTQLDLPDEEWKHCDLVEWMPGGKYYHLSGEGNGKKSQRKKLVQRPPSPTVGRPAPIPRWL